MKGGAFLLLKQEYFTNKLCRALLVGKTNYVGDIIVDSNPKEIDFDRNKSTIIDDSQLYLFRKYLSDAQKQKYKSKETVCVFFNKESFEKYNPCGIILIISKENEEEE